MRPRSGFTQTGDEADALPDELAREARLMNPQSYETCLRMITQDHVTQNPNHVRSVCCLDPSTGLAEVLGPVGVVLADSGFAAGCSSTFTGIAVFSCLLRRMLRCLPERDK